MTNNINSDIDHFVDCPDDCMTRHDWVAPSATMTLPEVQNAADDIIRINWPDGQFPTYSQVKAAIILWTDDPDTTDTDRARIRVRIEQHYAS